MADTSRLAVWEVARIATSIIGCAAELAVPELSAAGITVTT